MSLLTSLLVLIVFARILGQLFLRMNQPAIVGEMLAGVILGPAVLGLIEAGPALHAISELAVFLVVISAGLEMNYKDIASVFRSRTGFIIAILGFVIPFSSGIGVGLLFELDVMRTVFIGLCISITALPVAVRILETFKLLNTDLAKYAVATAIFNDVLALLALGVILDLPEVKTFQAVSISIFSTSGKLLLLVLIVTGINSLVVKAELKGLPLHMVPEKLIRYFGPEALFGIVIIFTLLFGSVSEALGFHFVIGAFFGALFIDRRFFSSDRFHELERVMASLTGGFLAPVFFAYLGLEFAISEMQSMAFVISILLVSILSKVFAGWLGGRLAGMPNPKALGLGIILNARGVMELVFASIAYEKGFIGKGLFSTLILMGVVTTILTPMLFRRFVPHDLEADQNLQWSDATDKPRT